MTSTRDYYEILSVTRTASAEELKRSFYKLARQYHPDVNKEPDAATRFKEINEAYQVLSDPEKRASYDRFGKAGVGNNFDGGFSDVPLNDIFETIFGAGFGGRTRTRRGPQPGAHLKTTLTLEFEEAVFGADKEISVPRLETCPSCKGVGAEPGTTPTRCPQCRGSGEVRRATQSIFGQFINVAPCPRCGGEGEIIATPCHECGGQKRVQVMRKLVVKVPAGVDEGTQIRLQAEGESGTSGGPSGHLYVQIAIKPHPQFERDNQDLLYTLPLNIAQASLGDEVTVPTLDGDEALKIPAGTQHGKTFRIKNKGVPNLKRSGRGDMIVTTRVDVPTHLSEKQKALLREFSRTMNNGQIPNEDKGLLDQLKDVIMGG